MQWEEQGPGPEPQLGPGTSRSDVAVSIGDKVPRAPSPVHGTYQDSYKQWLSLLSGGSSSGPGALH